MHVHKLWASPQGRHGCLMLHRAGGSSSEGRKCTEKFQHSFIFFACQCCLLRCQRRKSHTYEESVYLSPNILEDCRLWVPIAQVVKEE